MVWHTEGIRVVAPVKWRRFDGLVGVFWEAESQAGAKGYYLADDPRIMVFFSDVSSRIRMSNRDGELAQHSRPMTRAVYVPAGVPMWTTSKSTHRFSHLNLHLHRDRLMRFLSPSVGASAALSALRQPVEIQDLGAIETLAGLLDIPEDDGRNGNGRLTQAQMNRLTARVEAEGDCRLTIAEMAATVGLSESWFANVFKQTTGRTPLQWQLGKRVDRAKQLLLESELSVADIAVQLGFSDQAHLTKTFRQIAGDTPAAWRRIRQLR